MTYQKFILRNIGRKKTRMLLTMGSFAVALFLFGLLVDDPECVLPGGGDGAAPTA